MVSSNTCLGFAGHQKGERTWDPEVWSSVYRDFYKQPRRYFKAQNLGGSKKKEGTEESEKVFQVENKARLLIIIRHITHAEKRKEGFSGWEERHLLMRAMKGGRRWRKKCPSAAHGLAGAQNVMLSGRNKAADSPKSQHPCLMNRKCLCEI